MRRVRERVLAKGFTAQQLESAIDEYAMIDVSQPGIAIAGESILICCHRSGKLQSKGPGWSSSRLAKMTKTWVTRTFDRRNLEVMIMVFGVSCMHGHGVRRRSKRKEEAALRHSVSPDHWMKYICQSTPEPSRRPLRMHDQASWHDRQCLSHVNAAEIVVIGSFCCGSRKDRRLRNPSTSAFLPSTLDFTACSLTPSRPSPVRIAS